MLASGLGLLAVGGTGLWRSLQDARTRVELLGEQESRRVAEGMRASLMQHDLLAGVPRTSSFAVRAGALVVPAEVGFVGEPPVDDMSASTPLVARLTALEIEGGNGARLQELRAAIDAGSDQPRADVLAWLAASWFAHRTGDAAWRDALRARLADALAKEVVAGEVADRVAISLALLAAHAREAAQGVLEERLLRALGRQPRVRADAVLRRLHELGGNDDLLARARAHVEGIAAWRGALGRAEKALPKLVRATAPLVEPLGDELLLYHPAGEGEGAGALLPARPILQGLFPAQRPDAGVALHLGTGPDPRGAGVVAGLASVVPGAQPAAAAPWLLAALVAALALLFTGALVVTLRGMRQQAVAQAARAEFLTSVTHELKTPLASLRLLSELLASERVQGREQQREYHQLLAGEAARLCALVENVLDLGRTERGERGFDLQPVEIGSLVLDTVALVFVGAGAVPVVDDAGRALVRADRAALTQALVNVLDNARKYGGGDAGIAVRVEADEREVRIAVRDRGPGVPEAERERIFAKFTRGRAQADGHVPGLGLGLYLARAVLRAHGGDLACQPPADGGAGAEFVLRLPRAAEGA